MTQEFEFEPLTTETFFEEGELEGESRRRGGSPRRGYNRYSKRKPINRQKQIAKLLAKQLWKKRRRPHRPPVTFPTFPIGGGVLQPGSGVTPDQPPNGSSAAGGSAAAAPCNCQPCVCPQTTAEPSTDQPSSAAPDQASSQPATDQPGTDQPGPDQPDTDQPSGDQSPAAASAEEFYRRSGLDFTSEYEDWWGGVNRNREASPAPGAAPAIIDLTGRADRKRRIRIRQPREVDTLVLHQMACCFRVKDPLTRFLKMAPHFAILPDGRILQLHPLMALTGASNGFNRSSVAVEFAGNFPDTRGRWWHGPQNGRNKVTQAQIEAGRFLIKHLIQVMGLKKVVAHRQSSGTRDNDPGPDIWYHVGQWAIQNLGLTDGGPGFKIGTGKAIPDVWRQWGQNNPKPELELYESVQGEATPAKSYVKDFSGPASECTAALTRAGKTKAQALSIINLQIARAIVMLRKASGNLTRGKRTCGTSEIFQRIFRVKPEFVPTWLKPTATIKDRGDVVATRCQRVADLLESGTIKFFCAINSTNCPDCSGPNAYACSSWGDESKAPKKSNVICLGTKFWDDMKAGRSVSMLATLMHEPFHIYFGKYVTTHDPDRGKFGGIYCILQFVFELSPIIPPRVTSSCAGMKVRP